VLREIIILGEKAAVRKKVFSQIVICEVLRREALPLSLEACRIVPAGLGEAVGDYAGLSVAMQALEDAEPRNSLQPIQP